MIGTSQVMFPKRIVHIGTGPWGQNYLKVYKAFTVDVSVATRDSWRSLVDERPDGVVICTPPQTHIEIAQFALERNIPVMIEKPLALSAEEAEQLAKYAAPVLVDHLYLFTDGYQSLKRNIAGKQIRTIKTVGLGTRSHTGYSALWDYGSHDISMILDLMNRTPNIVSAIQIGSIFEIELHFSDTVTHSRFGISGERVRRVAVQCEGEEVIFEDIGSEIPGPLHNAVAVFLETISGETDQRLGLGLALDVLKVLEACEKSVEVGMPVPFTEYV